MRCPLNCQRLEVRFLSGTEGAWRASLRGTLPVTRAFVEYVPRIATAGAPTQPHGSASGGRPGTTLTTRPFAPVRPEQRI